MKKYKVYFSIFNLLTETQAEVAKLQMLFKAISATAISGTWYASDANHAMFVGVGGIIVDTLIACLYFEDKSKKFPVDVCAPTEQQINNTDETKGN